MLRFYENVRSSFFCGHNILTDGVFVTQLSSNVGISLTDCVGYDKLLFHE